MADMLKKAEQKTGVNSKDIMNLAQSLNGTDLSNEKNIRRVIKQVSRLADKKVSKSTEDTIVEMLKKNQGKIDHSTISKML